MESNRVAIRRGETWRLARLTALAACCLAMLGLVTRPADAATLTWGTSGTGGSGTWTATDGWWNGTTQQTWSNAAPDDAVFGGGAGDPGGSIMLAGGTTTAGSITFNTFTGTYTIGTASQALRINGGGITVNADAGAVTIQNSPITLGAAQSWTNNSSSLLVVSSGITNGGNLLTVAGSGNATLSGAIAGSGGLTKSGAGTLMLSGVNTYYGTTTVNGGLLTSNTATSGVGLSSFGTGAISIGSSGTLQLTGSNGGSTASPFTAYYTSGYTNAVSGSGALIIVGQSGNFSVNYSGNLSGFTGTVSATAAAGTWVGFGNSSTMSLNATGSSAKFVVSGAGNFVSVLGATGTIAMGELSGDGNIYGNLSHNTTWEIGGLSTSSTFSGRMFDRSGGTAPKSVLRKIGSGTLTLTGSSAYSGGTQLNAGTIVVGHTAGLGTGTVTLGGGLLQSAVVGTIATPISIAVASGTFDSQSNANTLSGVISGSGNFVKLGSGTLTLSGSNAYTGQTRVSAGVLALGASNRISDQSGLLVDGGGLSLGGFNDTVASVTLTSGSIFGAGTLTSGSAYDLQSGSVVASLGGSVGLVKSTAGTLTLSGSNSYAGGSTVTSGLVIGSNRSSFGTGTIALAASGTVQLTAAASGVSPHPLPAYYSNGYTNALTGSGVLRLVSQSNLYGVNYSGDLSGFTGTVSATNASGQFTGLGNIDNPALNLTGSNTKFLVSGPGQSFAVLTSSGTIVMGELNGDGALAAANAVTTVNTTWQIGSLATSSTFSGRFSDNDAGKSIVAKVGSGTLTLSGNSSYSGGTQINAGVLASSNLNSFGSGTVTIGASGTVQVTALAAGYWNNGYTNAVTGSGVLQLSSTANSTSSVNYSGDLSGFTGTVSVTTGSGFFTAIGDATTANFLSGSNAKFVISGATGSFFPLSTVSTGTFAMGELSGDGKIVNRATANSILRVGDLSTSSTYSGLLSNNSAGTLGLIKVGSGTLTLSGVNTYSGSTTVNGGLLTSNTATSGVGLSSFGSGVISIGSSGTLQLTGSNGGSTTAPFTAYYASGYTNAVSGSGTLRIVGQSDNFSVNYSGDLSGFQGTVSATAAAGMWVGLGNSSTMSLNMTGSNARFVVSGAGKFLGVLGATGTIAMGELSGDGTIHASLNRPTTWEIGALSTSSTFSGGIFNDTTGLNSSARWSSLRKVGSGTLTLSGSSAYSGGTELGAGTIVVSNSSSLGTGTVTLGGGLLQSGFAGAIANPIAITATSGTFDSQANVNTLSGAIGGTGALVKTGVGTLTLSASNSYSGGTQIDAGVLASSANAGGGVGLSSFGTGSITIGSSGTLQLTGSNGGSTISPFTAYYASGYTNTVSGSGTLSLVGQSTNFSVNYSGDLSGFQGTVSATAAAGMWVGLGNSTTMSLNATGSNARFVVSGAGNVVSVLGATGTFAMGELTGIGTIRAGLFAATTWEIGALSTSSTFNGGIFNTASVQHPAGVSSLRKVGSGTLTLSGSNGYTGATTISAGRLALAGNGVLGNGSYAGAIANAGEFAFGSDVAQILSGQISGTGAVVKSGSGTLTLSGNSSYSGGTRIDAGILGFGSATGLGTGTVTLGGGVLRSAVNGTIANPISITAASGTFDSQSNANTLSGAIGGTGALVKTGAGTVTLSASNSYSGGTQIDAGVLASPANPALTVRLSSFGAGAISIGASGTLQLTGYNGGAGVAPFTAYYASGYTNTVSGSGTLSLVGQSSSFSVNYSGNLSGFTGIVSATAAVNTWVGYGNSSNMSLNATGSNTRFVVSGAGKFLSVLGATGTIALGELGGDGNIHSNLNYDTTWEIGALSTSSTFSGGIFNDTLSTRLSSLRKVGSGTLTLTGSSSYTGGTTIAAGRLALTGNGVLGSGSYAGAIANAGEFVFGSNVAQILSGQISGTGSLVKAGAATLMLSGSNTYSGNTTISAGTLRLAAAGSLANSGRIIVGDAGSSGAVLDLTDKTSFAIGAGQTLMGGGTALLGASTALTVSGTFSPGNSPGLFTYDGGSTTLAGTTLLEIWGTTRATSPSHGDGVYDAVNVVDGGLLTTGGTLVLDFNQNFADSASFLLFDTLTGGSLAGGFESITITGVNNDYAGLSFTQAGNVWTTGFNANDQALRLTQTTSSVVLDVIVVPEPGALALAGCGVALAGWIVARRSRRR